MSRSRLFPELQFSPRRDLTCGPSTGRQSFAVRRGGGGSETEMDADRWLAHFQANRESRSEPDWAAPITLAPAVVKRLVKSLEQFQLGDGGGPASLIAWNAESFCSTSDASRQLVDLWFKEEKEHSRLLCCAVARFGGQPILGHWSFTIFCWVRRLFGVAFELTVLLLTEIVSTVYYRLMYRHGSDPALRAMCRLILRDEIGHVAFHRDRLARRAGGRATFYGRWWELTFRVLGLAAATMLWINHAPALKALGATRSEFYRAIWRELSMFIWRLRRETALAPNQAQHLTTGPTPVVEIQAPDQGVFETNNNAAESAERESPRNASEAIL